MRSGLRALIWEQSKPILPVMAACISACVLFNLLCRATWNVFNGWRVDIELSALFSTGALAAFFIVMLLTSADPNDLRPRFGARLYRLPMTTFTMVTTLFVLRLVLVAIEVTAILGVFSLWLDGSPGSYEHAFLRLSVPTVAALVATYAVLQAIGWTVGNASTKAALLLGLLLIVSYGGGAALIGRWHTSGHFYGDSPLAWLERLLGAVNFMLYDTAGFVACLVGSHAAIWAGVTLDRRGWFQNRRGLGDWAASLTLVSGGMPRRFRSPAAAQRWLEWRRMGLILPGFVLLVLAMSILIPSVLELASRGRIRGSYSYFHNLFVFQTASLFLGAILAAMALAAAERHDQRTGLARFIAVRPLSTWGIVRARFEAGLMSVVLITALLAVVSLAWAYVIMPAHVAAASWIIQPKHLVMRVATFVFAAALLWGILLAAIQPIAVLANRTAASLLVLAAALLGGINAVNMGGWWPFIPVALVWVVLFLLYVLARRTTPPGGQNPWRHALEGSGLVTVAVIWTIAVYHIIMPDAPIWLIRLPISISVVVVAVVAGMALLLYRPAYRKGLIGPDAFCAAIVGWIMLFSLYVFIQLPGSGLLEQIRGSDYLLAAGLCMIPLGPLAGVPLAVEHWRHNQTGHKGWML